MEDTTSIMPEENTQVNDDAFEESFLAGFADDDAGTDFESEGADVAAEETTETETTLTGDEGEPAGEGVPAGEGEQQAEKPAQTEQAKHILKHLGQQREFNTNELLPLAQKGLDYDRAKSKIAELENLLAQQQSAPERQLINSIANKLGMDPSQYIEYMENQFEAGLVREYTEQGVPEDKARRLVQLERGEQMRSRAQMQAQEQKNTVDRFAPLLEKYPHITEVPQEVALLIRERNVDPLVAYELYMQQQESAQRAQELEKAQKELDVFKKAEANKTTTPQSAKNKAATAQHDNFLSGFYGGN